MKTESDPNLQLFREETDELLNDLEAALLETDERPDDEELISRIFRALHTVKGNAAMFGFDAVSAFVHDIETVFDRIRDGKLRADKEVVKLTLTAADQVRKMLDGSDGDDQVRAVLAMAYRRLLDDDGTAAAHHVDAAEMPAKRADFSTTYRIRFSPPEDIFSTGTNPVLLLQELQALGACRITAEVEGIPDLDAIDPHRCYTCWDIVLTTDREIDAIRDVFIFVEDISRITVEEIDADGAVDQPEPKLGQILLERGDVDPNAIDEALRAKKKIGDLLVESGATSRDSVVAALMEQEHLREWKEKKKAQETVSSIRVASEKLDKLVNLVGELVIAEARLSRSVSGIRDSELRAVAEDIERLTADLRDSAMGIRMVPVNALFGRFRRLVHDLSLQLGKEVEIVSEGGSTELDKTVIERLNDPLVHLIRNCIDHGLETPEERLAAGKERKGIVRLSARYAGAHVVIEIDDDGRGLDRQAIREKAVANGLISQGAHPGDKETFDLIFLPGFSTATEISNVSGRGVGMDVVKKSVEGLRGTIEIKSNAGLGTSVAIRLPLTLAIVEGLLVRVGNEHFVVPVSFIDECVELEASKSTDWNSWVTVRDSLVPCVRLKDHFSMDGDRLAREQVVVIRSGGTTAGLVVDDIVGEVQAVTKALGRAYQHVQGISGATILGDGRIALILDVQQLIDLCDERQVAVTG